MISFFKRKKSPKKQRKQRKPRVRRRFSKLPFFFITIIVGTLIAFLSQRLGLGTYIKQIKSHFQNEKEESWQLQEATEEVLPLVKVFHVTRVNFSDSLHAVGTVKGSKEIDLMFQTAGNIKDIFVKEGDLIAKDDLLAQLDDTELQYKVKYQKANYETARSAFLGQVTKLQNAEKLWLLGSIAKSKYNEALFEAENAGYKMKSAKVEWDSAASELRKAQIFSPINGVLGMVHMDPGEYYNTNNAPKVVTVVDINPTYVEIGVIERDIPTLAIGLPVTISVDAYPDEFFKGSVINLLPMIEGKSRTLTVRAQIANDEQMLLPGMYAHTEIEIFQATNTIAVPIMCLKKNKQGDYFVHTVNSEDIVTETPIQVGYVSSDTAQIVEGLKTDDFVVVETQQEIKQGTRVQIIEVQTTTLEEYVPEVTDDLDKPKEEEEEGFGYVDMPGDPSLREEETKKYEEKKARLKNEKT